MTLHCCTCEQSSKNFASFAILPLNFRGGIIQTGGADGKLKMPIGDFGSQRVQHRGN